MKYLEQFLKRLIEYGSDLLFKILICGIIAVVGVKIIDWFIKKFKKSKLYTKIDVSLGRFLLSFMRIGLYVLLFITVASIVGVPMASFVTLLASAGVAIGLALQGALSNLAGGVMILFFKPFKIGDYVEVTSGAGTVSDITVFYTKLLTPDNKVITIPNGDLTNAAVVNYSEKNDRRVDLEFTASYDSDIDVVESVMLGIAKSHRLVYSDPQPFAKLNAQRDSSMSFVLRVWCKNEDYWTVYFDLQEQVKKAFDENDIEIPFPQLNINAKAKN